MTMSGHSRTSGFTLLEVLIASLLMTMLLTTLWGVLNIYSRLFETGGIQVRQAQLSAAIERQLSEDLQSAIEDTPLPNTLASVLGLGVVRRFGLQGTATMLRFDVRQTIPEDQLPSIQDVLLLGRASTTEPQAPELRTVVYRFIPKRTSRSNLAREEALQSKNASSADTPVRGSGLVRWEIGFETPLERSSGQTQPPKKPSREAGASFDDLAAQTIDAEKADNAITWLPEVRSATFRYFDGRSWSDSWNSLQRGSLPVAVEMQIRLYDSMEEDDGRRSRKEADATADKMEPLSDGVPTAPDEEQFSAQVERPTYRFLIRLPTARQRPEIKPATISPLGSEIRAQENLPSVMPAPAPLWSPDGHATEDITEPFPDQWLRTVR